MQCDEDIRSAIKNEYPRIYAFFGKLELQYIRKNYTSFFKFYFPLFLVIRFFIKLIYELRDWFLGIILSCFVLILLYIGESQKLTTESDRTFMIFVNHHVDAILMAILIGFLGLVLFRAEKLKQILIEHQKDFINIQKEFLNLKSSLINFKSQIDQAFTAYMNLTKNRQTIIEKAKDSINKEAFKTLESRASEIEAGWAELILIKKTNDENDSLNYLSSKCFELMYDTYMEEEKKDIWGTAYDNIFRKDLPSYIVATNYPTYLNFIDKLANNFVSEVANVHTQFKANGNQYKAAIFAIANNLPIEWVMLCKREDDKFKCKADSSLLAWRKTSKLLVELTNAGKILFKRTFVTQTGLNGINAPSNGTFNDQLKFGAWYKSNDDDILTKSYSMDSCKEFDSKGVESPKDIKYEDNIFYLSKFSSKVSDININGNMFKKIMLEDFLEKSMHSNDRNTFNILNMTTASMSELEPKGFSGFPLDMLIVGVLPIDKNTFEDFNPVMGVACISSDSERKISILNFFTKNNLDKFRNLIIHLANTR